MALEDFWEAFGVDKLEEIDDVETGSLAQKVLISFGIQCNDSRGGHLPGLDIKQTDALTVVRLSLLEYSAKGGDGFYEVMMNEEGEAEFVKVGGTNGMQNVNIYQEIQTSSYVEECTGVMVTGGKSRPSRLPINWKPIWGDENDSDRSKMLYTFENMTGNCLKDQFKQHCTIVYNDPHLTSGREGYKDGYNSLFEELYEESPFNTIIGYARYIEVPENLLSTDTVVQRKADAKVFIKIGNGEDGEPFGENGAYLGKEGGLLTKPTFKEDAFNSPDCYQAKGGVITPKDGVKIVIPENLRYTDVNDKRVDKFVGVSAVYVLGYVIDFLKGKPHSKAAEIKTNPTPDDVDIVLFITDPIIKVIQLSEGEHYVMAYENVASATEFTQPYVVFVNGSSIEDPSQYGTNCKYKIDPFCTYMDTGGIEPGAEYVGSVLPTGFNQGILVKEIYVSVNVNTPSIEIYDPDGSNNKAVKIAQQLQHQLTPLALYEPPPPKGYAGKSHPNGIIINQAQGVRDHRPDTAEDFEDTEEEKIMDEMQGSGLTLNFSFLEENECEELAKVLYTYMNSGDGVISTYVCGPESEPKLGGYGPDNSTVVNEITYSYSDSNSYTISVTTGPKIIGNLTQVDGGPTLKASENVQMQATIVEDQGSNVWFKVRIDGYGIEYAISCTPNLLRVGDKVSVTIHNNPIES
jgi:hypothetical protein